MTAQNEKSAMASRQRKIQRQLHGDYEFMILQESKNHEFLQKNGV